MIENVVGAPLIDPFMLCGSSFALEAHGRELQRHRLFETSFPVTAPQGAVIADAWSSAPTCATGHRPQGVNHVSGSSLPISIGREAMRISWMTGEELSEAIPPVYVEFIGRAFLRSRKAAV